MRPQISLQTSSTEAEVLFLSGSENSIDWIDDDKTAHPPSARPPLLRLVMKIKVSSRPAPRKVAGMLITAV
jgi:hypothetical protein